MLSAIIWIKSHNILVVVPKLKKGTKRQTMVDKTFGGELWCFGSVSSPCSTKDTRRVTFQIKKEIVKCTICSK